ncbi:MAG: hypothetical protein AAFR17_07135 [Pseudomonadota bacterium]
MRRSPRPTPGLVRFLVDIARSQRLITYADLARECGGAARRQTPRLRVLAERCHALGVPLLPVLVVNAMTRLPTLQAEIYRRRGLISRTAILAEQERCFHEPWGDREEVVLRLFDPPRSRLPDAPQDPKHM